jgi:hypothetical protein
MLVKAFVLLALSRLCSRGEQQEKNNQPLHHGSKPSPVKTPHSLIGIIMAPTSGVSGGTEVGAGFSGTRRTGPNRMGSPTNCV